MGSWLPVLIVVAFCTVFPLIWCAVLFLAASFGWARFADEFGTDRSPDQSDNAASFQSIHFGSLFAPSQHSNCVTIAPTERGVLIAPSMIVFRPFHRNLLIPWKKIDAITQGRMLFFKTNTLHFRGGYPRLHIYNRIGDEVRRAWSNATGRTAS